MEVITWISILVFLLIVKSFSVLETIGDAVSNNNEFRLDTTGQTDSNSRYSDKTETNTVDISGSSNNTKNKNNPDSVSAGVETNEYGEIKE